METPKHSACDGDGVARLRAAIRQGGNYVSPIEGESLEPIRTPLSFLSDPRVEVTEVSGRVASALEQVDDNVISLNFGVNRDSTTEV